ncbi:MAG: hypothetical protein IKH60_03030 [Bacteroidales bacterium]|nr:hypothetical protein [Bacteroidales bacterium]
MRAFSIFAAFLVLISACTGKLPPEDIPSEEPAKEAGPIFFGLAVKYPQLIEHLSDTEDYLVELPFDKNDQMVVTGEGISGTLKYDRFYIFPYAVGFSGYLTYDGPGGPPADLVLNVKRINPSFSNDGNALTGPAATMGLEEAVNRYGVSSGTCTYGNPAVELSQSTAFYSVTMDVTSGFPAGKGNKVTLIDNGKAYGPFDFDPRSEEALVLALPGGAELTRPMLELDGIAKFPISPDLVPISQESFVLESGHHYWESVQLRNLSAEWYFSPAYNTVYYQPDPQTPTRSTISAFGEAHNVFLSNINIESNRTAISFGNDTFVWVDGNCRAVSTDGSSPAIFIASGSSLHIKGDGNLIAESNGEGEGGAGINFGSFQRDCGDIYIEGAVSVQAKGAAGAAGIGMGKVTTTQAIEFNCGNIFINTTGTVKAVGGAGAAGIGSGRLPYWDCSVYFGSISVLGGIVDATGGGEGAPDIGVCEGASIPGGVSVGAGVTYDGVHGYHVVRTDGTVPAAYDKD